MDTVSVQFTTTKETKKKAEATAKRLGFSLDLILAEFLTQLIRKKTITFNPKDEKPNAYLKEAIKQARKERKEGKASPVFDNAEDVIKWLGI